MQEEGVFSKFREGVSFVVYNWAEITFAISAGALEWSRGEKPKHKNIREAFIDDIVDQVLSKNKLTWSLWDKLDGPGRLSHWSALLWIQLNGRWPWEHTGCGIYTSETLFLVREGEFGGVWSIEEHEWKNEGTENWTESSRRAKMPEWWMGERWRWLRRWGREGWRGWRWWVPNCHW